MTVRELIAERYQVEELIGTGGMSSVYRAYDTLLERRVALKVLHEQFVRDGDYVERFGREARSVAQLSHPNIVTGIDRGEQDGRPFNVGEDVNGECPLVPMFHSTPPANQALRRARFAGCTTRLR